MQNMSRPTIKTFAYTIRPRGGISDSDIVKFHEYLRKKADYYYLVTEKEDDERHIHACCIRKKAVTRANASTELTRLFKELDADEKKVLLQGLKVWSSREFLDYMNKGDSTVVIAENLPEAGCLESYFPVTNVNSSTKKLQHHALMERLESLWHKHVPPHWAVNTENVRHFLTEMQYDKREIGLMNDKHMFQVAKWLTRWMLKANHCVLPLPQFDVEEGEDFLPLIRH